MYYDENIDLEVDSSGLNKFMAKVYGWMFLGLLVTAFIAIAMVVGIYTSDSFLNLVVTLLNGGIYVLFIAELVLVWRLSAKINTMKVSTARFMFLLYSIMNGVIIGIVCMGFGVTTVYRAFLMTAVAFGVMSLYGYKTNADLSKAGNIFKMGLIGLILISLLNIFLGSSSLDWIISIAGMIIFLGLTAYDTKKIRNFYINSANNTDETLVSKVAVIGALELYLDFINLFLYILRIFSRRN